MDFDIIEVTDDYYAKLTSAQRQLLRNTQKKKNELEREAEKNIALYRRQLYTNSVQNSSLLEQKTKEISDELTYEIDVLREQLLYSISLSETPSGGTGSGGVQSPYRVDYSLSYTERYIIVRDYYLSIPNSDERLSRYLADEVAKDYLGRYYSSLYNVLLTYS